MVVFDVRTCDVLGLGEDSNGGGNNMNEKWDKRFLELALFIGQWSKDPSTKCGAVITRDKKIISTGFNGFPQGVEDCETRLNNREQKLSMVIHAEVNALNFAHCDVTGCTIYVSPMPPCCRCATQIIQRGIKQVITVTPSDDALSRWGDDFEVSKTMYREAGVKLYMRVL